MGSPTFDINLPLTLAATAEAEGDFETALEFLAEAHFAARTSDRAAQTKVHWTTAMFHARHPSDLPLRKQLALSVLASIF